MKKYVLIAGLLMLNAVSAQPIYKTKSGKVTFSSDAPLEKIEAVNQQADAKLATNGQMVFMVAIKAFKFANATMEEHFNENYMESTKYPRASFMGTVTNLKEVDFTKDGTYKVAVTGNMTIHGITKPVTATGTIEVKGGKVHAKSKFTIKLADYGIKGAWIGEKIAREVDINVDCKFD
jgi:polyisoprenoid-binding protein YceI